VAATRTIGALWRDAVARASTRPPYLAERDGAWVEVSWPEAAGRVDDLANGLLALGVKKGDAFSILASTSLEWCLFDFALGLIGAIGAPVYANSSPRDAAYVLGHSEAVGVLVEDEEQLAKVESVRSELPCLRHVFTFAGLTELEARAASTPPPIPRPSPQPRRRSTRTISSPTSTPPVRPGRRRAA